MAESALRQLVPQSAEPFVRSYNPFNPAFRETMRASISDLLGGRAIGGTPSQRYRANIADMLTGAVEMAPGVGEAVGVTDTRQAMRSGDYGTAAILGGATALGMVPVIGDAASRAVREGLDMSTAARMQRARDMGLDPSFTLYHGTGDDIREFDLSIAKDMEGRKRGLGLGSGKIYLHGDPQSASAFAMNAPSRGLGKNPNVMQVISTGNYIDENDYKRMFMQNSGGVEITSGRLNMRERDALIKKTDKQVIEKGFDGIAQKYKDSSGNVVGFGQVAVFDPSHIRSINADFDPAKRGTARLMAGLAGTAVGLSALNQLVPRNEERQPD